MSNKEEIVPALFCIPDINNFTRFMSETDIEYSRKIIPSLLKSIISSNTLGFEVGEVEGDAILFYKTGPIPTLKDLAEQFKKIYTDFASLLRKLENENGELLGKYLLLGKLGLKIIVHYGDTSFIKIGGITKMIGEDVVVAHKLLKNSVKEDEYLLLSEKFLSNYSAEEIYEVFDWASLNDCLDEYEHLGVIKYRYISFTSLEISLSKEV